MSDSYGRPLRTARPYVDFQAARVKELPVGARVVELLDAPPGRMAEVFKREENIVRVLTAEEEEEFVRSRFGQIRFQVILRSRSAVVSPDCDGEKN